MTAKAFVTGGSGFLGGRLIDILVERMPVRALARSEASAAKVVSRGAEAVAGDLDSVEAMSGGMAGCEQRGWLHDLGGSAETHLGCR